MKSIIKNLLPLFFVKLYHWLRLSKAQKLEKSELQRIKKQDRYQEGYSSIFSATNKIKYTDSASFVFIYNEIFKNKIYKFNSTAEVPLIIDAGANIGLSVIYFKKLFPTAKVIAFEPDPNVFSVLEYNVKKLELDNVELICKALWSSESELQFEADGADAGRVHTNEKAGKSLTIKTTRLSTYLKDKTIDLLKIDIEGAELIVLEESKELLKNVKRLFVEFHSYEAQPQNIGRLLNILENEGFRIIIHPAGAFSATPFEKIVINSGMDLQLNIFGVRD